jgi:hypothetical protein
VGEFCGLGEGLGVPCEGGLVCVTTDLLEGRCYPDIAAGPSSNECLAFFDRFWLNDAISGVDSHTGGTGQTLAFGYGASASFIADTSIERGVAYGRDGCFACYETQCDGINISAGVDAFATETRSSEHVRCPGAKVCSNNRSTSCSSSSECGGGFCAAFACSSAPERACTQDSDCPDGGSCERCNSFDGQSFDQSVEFSTVIDLVSVGETFSFTNCPPSFVLGGFSQADVDTQCDLVSSGEQFSVGLSISSPINPGFADCNTTTQVAGCLLPDDNGELSPESEFSTNQAPVCNAGSSYSVECTGATTSIALNGSGSSDPDGNALTHTWSSSCGGASFSSATAVSPTLTINSSGATTSCTASLSVSDSMTSSSCNAAVTVVDTTDPSVSCPGDRVLECSSTTDTSTAANGVASGSDTCDPSVAISRSDHSVLGCAGVQTISRNWTATDDAGLSDICTQTISVRDTIRPAISCPADISRETTPGQCSLSIAYAVTTSDACDGSPLLSCTDQTGNPVGVTGDTFPVGDTTVTCTAMDCSGNTNACSFDVEVNDRPQITAITPASQTVQYSDTISPVTVTATDCGPGPLTLTSSGVASALTLPAAATSCTPTSGGVECTFTLSGQVKVPSGSYPVTATPADEQSLTGASSSIGIQVTAEDALVALASDNPVLVDVVAPDGDSVPFVLKAQIEELVPDTAAHTALPGDIKNAVATLTLVPVGPGSSESVACSALNTPPADTYGGSGGILEVGCSFADVPVNTYQVMLEVGSAGDGVYYRGTAEDVLTVFDPSLGFITGGGWFTWPGTDDRTNFGVNAKYNKKRTNIQGGLLLIRHLPDGTKYRVKSNALEGLSLGDGGGFGWATFTGKNSYLEPGWLDAVGNHSFIIYVEDHGEPGAGVDRLWIDVRDRDGNVVTLSLPDDAVNNAVTIGGGNIAVPHKTGPRER